jgi:OOP family OmpA-OmpF porin
MPGRTGESLEASGTPDTRLAEALGPTVEAALKRSVRSEPRLWAETIFPIVLPAIRMAIASALREMVLTLNQMLEHGLSLKSWRWRLESWRAGRSFAEVVLLRTLVYRVEQVLLIDRNTGLLLLSVAALDVMPQDTSLISAMLTAIQDFIHDSFDVDRGTDIRELHIGDFSLWIEQGPRAAIAAAVRGNAPVELRETLRAAVDLVHQEFRIELRQFQGDSLPFERCRAVLEGCLRSQYQTPRKASRWKARVCIACVAAMAILWAGVRIRQARQWNRALAALHDMPGIMITQGSREGGTYVVEGLRDPLAESPQGVLARHGVDPRRVSMRFRPFLSLDSDLVLKRVRFYLQPPDSVSIAPEQGVLTIRGTAPHEWILQTRSTAAQFGVAGIREIRTGDLRDSDLDRLRTAIEGQTIEFAVDSSVVGQKEARVASMIGAQAREWTGDAIAIGKVPRVQVVGYADPSGTSRRNRDLSQERAAHVAAFLFAAAVPREMVEVVGREGSPSGVEASAMQRKVVFQLVLDQGREERREAR